MNWGDAGTMYYAIERDHVRALARVDQRDRATDPGITAGDQRLLARQLAGRAVVLRLEARLRLELGLEAGLLELLRRERRAGSSLVPGRGW